MLRIRGLIFVILLFVSCKAGPSTSEQAESQSQIRSESYDTDALLISSAEEEVRDGVTDIAGGLSATFEAGERLSLINI